VRSRGRSPRLRLLDVADRAVAVRFANRLTDLCASIAGDDDKGVDDITCGVKDAFQECSVADREQRLGTPVRQRSHPGPAARREHDSVHARIRHKDALLTLLK